MPSHIDPHDDYGYPKFRCDNCGHEVDKLEDLSPITDTTDRLTIGAPIPAGECPKCKALAYGVGDPIHFDPRDWILTWVDCHEIRTLKFSHRSDAIRWLAIHSCVDGLDKRTIMETDIDLLEQTINLADLGDISCWSVTREDDIQVEPAPTLNEEPAEVIG